jgi:hypothetical protein
MGASVWWSAFDATTGNNGLQPATSRRRRYGRYPNSLEKAIPSLWEDQPGMTQLSLPQSLRLAALAFTRYREILNCAKKSFSRLILRPTFDPSGETVNAFFQRGGNPLTSLTPGLACLRPSGARPLTGPRIASAGYLPSRLLHSTSPRPALPMPYNGGRVVIASRASPDEGHDAYAK